MPYCNSEPPPKNTSFKPPIIAFKNNALSFSLKNLNGKFYEKIDGWIASISLESGKIHKLSVKSIEQILS